MKRYTSRLEDSNESRIEEKLSHLHLQSIDEDGESCQICKKVSNDGDPVTLYLYRPAGHSGYTIGQCRCSDHNDDLTGLFTLGVRELVVDGRIGHSRPHDTNQTWPVLLVPSVRLISAPDTTSGRVVGDTSRTHLEDSKQTQNTGRNSARLAASGDTQSALSHTDRDGNAATIEPQTAGRLSDE